MEKLNLDIGKFNKSDISSISYTSIGTGLKTLDKAMNGGFKPGLTVLGAMPATGKSTLAFQIAKYVSRERPVLIFSLEMTRNQILTKLISSEMFSKFPENAVTVSELLNEKANKSFDDEKWKAIRETAEKVGEETKNIYITESSSVGVSAKKIQEEVLNFLNDNESVKPFVVVDYLQFLAPSESGTHTEKQVTDTNIEILTNLANSNGISILLISSLNRQSYDKPISMGAFKETGDIEYAADTLVVMSRNENEKSDSPLVKVSFNFLKQRYGASGKNVELMFNPKYSVFYDSDNPDILKTEPNYKKNISSSEIGATKASSENTNGNDVISDFLALPEEDFDEE